jgi:outer membrane lipoprotein carrier protein
LPAAARDLEAVLRAAEARYNGARSLTLAFEQSYEAQGRRKVESGVLELRKPGRMRWEYTEPAGKLFLSDGKWLWLVSPYTGRVERTRLKESEDLRAPLAFLLGKLDFRRSFSDLTLEDRGEVALVKVLPKSDRAPFLRAEFEMNGAGAIQRLRIQGVEGSRQEFVFRGERLNVPVADARFRYVPPAGIEVVEVETFGEAEP